MFSFQKGAAASVVKTPKPGVAKTGVAKDDGTVMVSNPVGLGTLDRAQRVALCLTKPKPTQAQEAGTGFKPT